MADRAGAEHGDNGFGSHECLCGHDSYEECARERRMTDLAALCGAGEVVREWFPGRCPSIRTFPDSGVDSPVSLQCELRAGHHSDHRVSVVSFEWWTDAEERKDLTDA